MLELAMSSQHAEKEAPKISATQRFLVGIRSTGRTLLDLAYPPGCIACREAVTEPGTLCASCWPKMRFIERPYCEKLGTPFTHDLGPGVLSPQAIADPPAYSRARAVARYEDGPVSQMVHRLKYTDRVELALPMGRWMARAGAELIEDRSVIVPVPLHRKRLFSRRFNQAALLAQAIAKYRLAEVDTTILRRTRPTLPQIGLTRAQRASNVQGAIQVAEEVRERIAGRKVVLVDDVLTSGATTDAASRTLLRAGAAQVDVLVFARVVRDA